MSLGGTVRGGNVRGEVSRGKCPFPGCYRHKIKTFAEICDISDGQLISNITRNPHHILNQLLPPVSAGAENYNLRPRKHNRHLPELHVSLMLTTFIDFFTVTCFDITFIDTAYIRPSIVIVKVAVCQPFI